MNYYNNLCCNHIYINEDKEDYKSYMQMDAIMKRLFSINRVLGFRWSFYDPRLEKRKKRRKSRGKSSYN